MGLFNPVTHENGEIISGGEFRLFPCRATPDGLSNSVIGVTIAITPARPNVRVWARSFDVDDPSWHEGPVDSGDATGSSSDMNEDNRPSVSSGAKLNGVLIRLDDAVADGQGRIDEFTDANGELMLDFDVSTCQQSGNNFRIVAGFTPNAIVDHIVSRKSDSAAKVRYLNTMQVALMDSVSETPCQLKQSPLLTIWRILHMEVDVMSAATSTGDHMAFRSGQNSTGFVSPTDNSVLSLSGGIMNGTIQGQEGWLDLGPPGSWGRFADPLLYGSNPPTTGDARIIANNITMRVLSNTGGTVTLDGDATALQNAPSFVLYDDDTMINGSPLYLNHLQNSVSPMLNALAECYIQPVYDGGGSSANNQLNLPFVLNHDDDSSATSVDTYKGCSGALHKEYWVAYLQAAYSFRRFFMGVDEEQNPVEYGDNDPNSEETFPAGITNDAYGGTLIFMEDIADELRENGWGGTTVFNKVAIHELGHQLGCGHPETQEGADVMGDTLSDNQRKWFGPQNMDVIRGMFKPVQWTN